LNDIRDAMVENAPRAAVAADDDGEGVECAIDAGNGVIAGDDRPLFGGESDIAAGGCWIYLSMKNFSFDKWPLLSANLWPKLRKSFSTNIMNPRLDTGGEYPRKCDNTDPDRFD
jgi:hypothetical protein